MKIYQIREMSDDDLHATLTENHEALENFRFQQAAGQLENFSSIKNTKRDIAKIMTVINERKLGINKKINSKNK